MGNCLSACTTRTPGQNGGELVISYSGGKIFQSPKEETPQMEKNSKEYTIVQKELQALQTQISHSQAVLASLKFTFLEATVVKANNDQVHRTTQTLHEAGGLPKSLDDVTSTAKQTEKPELARSCPAIASTAVQTDCDSRRHYEAADDETECFLPPIGSPLDLQRHKDQLTTAQNGLDLDIYRSCRKLSVLPEEESEEPGQYKSACRYTDQQAHSFDSYLVPVSSPSVVRQLSDPTHSARRPLQVSTLLHIEVASGVEDSGLGSELRVSSPSPSTPCWKTPPATPSSDDNSLSWLTPTDSTSPEPEKQLLSVLLDPGGCLANEQPLVRVPSRRRLVRSLARIGSEAPFDFDFSEVPSAANMNGIEDGKEETTAPNQTIFPNLSDNDLRRLGLCVQPSNEDSEAAMGEENIESNYASLVLAFKTDKITLSRRLELQNKLRDQAEINMTQEVEALRTAVELLANLCTDVERNDFFEKIRHTIELLYRSALRVSSTAEIYGAVQQENRLSKAIDIVLKYVDNLKQLYEKEKTEHEETRKLLKESKTPATTPTDMSKRRASIATLHQLQIPTEATSASGERRGSLSRRGSQLRRATLSKNDSQNDILRTNGTDGESFDKIIEGCETCGSRLKPDGDSNTSHPNSSDESSTEESKIIKRSTSFKEDGNVVRKSTPRHKFRKRSSFTSPLWVMKISKYLQWLRPYEDYALQIRYFIASLFVLAAFCVVAASFFQRVEA